MTSFPEQPLYIVQKCWFDGPLVEPAVDFKLLFTNRAAAEAVAHQSAHLLAHRYDAVVRTLLLPSKEYGFSAAGSLFWVRTVYATVVEPSGSPWTQANVILTHGVIGGTGNPHARRGFENNHNRVFLGNYAQQAAFRVYQTGLEPHVKALSSTTAWPLATEVPNDLSLYWQRWPLGGSATTSILPAVDLTQLPDNKHGTTVVMEERPTKKSRHECLSPRRVSIYS